MSTQQIEYTNIETVNWNPQSDGGNVVDSRAYQASFVQNRAYETYEGKITKIEVKVHPNSTMGGAKIFLINSLTNEVIYVSDSVSVTTSKSLECYPEIIVSVPFRVGIAPISGDLRSTIYEDPSENPPLGLQKNSSLTYSSLILGLTWTSAFNYAQYSFSSRVSFLVTRGPINLSGEEVNYRKGSKSISAHNAINCSVLPSDKNETNREGSLIKPGIGDRTFQDYPGKILPAVIQGIRDITEALGCKTGNIRIGDRAAVNSHGVSLNIGVSSGAEYKYNLLVTPTHQHKSMPVNIQLSKRYGIPILGQYSLQIGDILIEDYSGTDTNLDSLSWSLNPSQLADGVNKAKISLKYPEPQKFEEISFEIFKEEVRRTFVERLFRNYDGGYSGDRLNAANKYGEIYPCFLVPDGSGSTLIKTTDFTSISLQKYLDIQGITIDAEGARVLVSFDKGTTWKSRIDGSWQSVDLSNIPAYGMDNDTLNGITLAQWSAVFKPTSIDFAIHLDNSLSNYYDYSSNKLMGSYSGTTSYTYLYPQAGYRLTDIVYTLKGNGSQSSSTYPTNYSVLSCRVGSTEVFGELSSWQLISGTYTFPNRLKDSESILFWKGHNAVPTNSVTVYQAPRLAYLKAINIQITPNLKTGYAFIM